MSSRRELALSLLSCLIGAALTLVAAGQAWTRGRAVQGDLSVALRVTGSSLAPVVPALAVAGLAGGLALVAVRGLVRASLGACLLACGSGAAVAAVANARPDAGSLAGRAGAALGTGTATAQGMSGTFWPWAALLGALLMAVGGGLATARGATWPGMSDRYSRQREDASIPVAPTAAPADAALEQWRAFDRGEDPTAD